MLCERCKEREASVHFTKIINNEKTELNLCEECAREYQEKFSFTFEPNFPIHHFLTSLFSDAIDTTRDRTLHREMICPVCNISYANFANSGKLGCSYCYENFQERLEPLLKRIHGSTQHSGKFPQRAGGKFKIKQQIRELKSQLQKLVAEEKFEKAAEVRDKVKELEAKLKE
ncbi:MAG: protein arginine kinase activator [Clostridia bacterium]|jgi:protein arginine kinase activator|nr:uvrB/uvrC motif family protein [Clostridiales bacterium]MDK2986692.1 protein arginine kinase activator [Clostridia bacterium]